MYGPPYASVRGPAAAAAWGPTAAARKNEPHRTTRASGSGCGDVDREGAVALDARDRDGHRALAAHGRRRRRCAEDAGARAREADGERAVERRRDRVRLLRQL